MTMLVAARPAAEMPVPRPVRPTDTRDEPGRSCSMPAGA
jgi:hypothetical protein